MSLSIRYILRWKKASSWAIITMETEQRHLQMLLTVSSFGESLRWLRKRPAEAFFNDVFGDVGEAGSLALFPPCLNGL